MRVCGGLFKRRRCNTCLIIIINNLIIDNTQQLLPGHAPVVHWKWSRPLPRQVGSDRYWCQNPTRGSNQCVYTWQCFNCFVWQSWAWVSQSSRLCRSTTTSTTSARYPKFGTVSPTTCLSFLFHWTISSINLKHTCLIRPAVTDSQGCKRDLQVRDRDETETFGF